jgi:multidrug efflux pump subunit AcrA (membrane-fusion protein)
LRHDTELKEAVKAGQAELERAKTTLGELHAQEIREVLDQLFKDIEAERELRKLERQRNNQLELVQISHAKIIKELDEKIRSKFFHLSL